MNIVLVFEKGKKQSPGNYRLVSSISVPGKVTDKFILGVLKNT